MSIKSKLQACIITLDEADNIVRCLSSLSGLVDSVLVYDTGSNDETVNIARRHGARTVQGYWDDDFSAARNRALELCDSEWILSIDADEVLYCDVQNGVQDGVRQSLLVDEDVQSFEVTIRNVLVAGGDDYFPAVTHSAIRLFRREQACWSGRLHERVVDKRSGGQLLTREARMFEIIHFGYAISRTDSKIKAERNLKLAMLEGSGNEQRSGKDQAITLLKTGKAKWATNRLDEALDDLLSAASADGEHGILAWMALKAALQVALWADNIDKAIELYDRLNTEFPASSYPNEGLPWSVLTFIVACIASDDHAALEIASNLDSATRQLAIAQAMNIGKNCASSLLEGTYNFFREQEDVLATLAVASRVIPQMDIETARRWSRRMRQLGLSELCPLMTIARDAEKDHTLRVHAATVAFSEFSDLEAGELLKTLDATSSTLS